MNKEELRRGVREMVVYLLDEEAGKDEDIVEGYTDSFMTGFDEYHKSNRLITTPADDFIDIDKHFKMSLTDVEYHKHLKGDGISVPHLMMNRYDIRAHAYTYYGFLMMK